jgi:hypothetical protein
MLFESETRISMARFAAGDATDSRTSEPIEPITAPDYRILALQSDYRPADAAARQDKNLANRASCCARDALAPALLQAR